MGKSAPEAPDPKETSAATTGTNIATSIADAILSNPSQTTPYGSVNYDFGQNSAPAIQEISNNSGIFGAGTTKYQVGDRSFGTREEAEAYQSTLGEPAQTYSWTDPYTGKTYSIPVPKITQEFTPEGQQLLDHEVATQLNLGQLAETQSGFLNEYMTQPFAYNPGEHENWALGLYGNLNGGEIDRQREALAARLANQGIGNGTEAYNREMQNFETSQMDSRNQFLLDSYNTGMQTALTNRNQPINEIIGLMNGSQVQQPNFVGANIQGIPTTDNASIIANNYNQQLAGWQQQQAATGSMLSGIGGLFQAGLPMLSDERAKDDKKKIGETKDGLGIYSYRYKGSPQTQIGLMAQEVKRKRPEAVHDGPGGLMMVDYKEATR